MDETGVPHFRIAWRAYWARPGIFVAAVLVMFGAWVALELAVISLQRFGVVLNVALHLAFFVVFSWLAAGLAVMCSEEMGGGQARLEQFFASIGRGPQVLLGALLYLLGTVAGLCLLLGPGIYFAVRYGLFGMVMATTRTSAVESFRAAGTLTNGRWRQACAFFLKVLLINLAGAALVGVGVLVSVPVTALATASFYLGLRERQAD